MPANAPVPCMHNWWLATDWVTNRPYAIGFDAKTVRPITAVGGPEGPFRPFLTADPILPDFLQTPLSTIMAHVLFMRTEQELLQWKIPPEYAKAYIALQNKAFSQAEPYIRAQICRPVLANLIDPKFRVDIIIIINPAKGQVSTISKALKDLYAGTTQYWENWVRVHGDVVDPPKESAPAYYQWVEATKQLHAVLDPVIKAKREEEYAKAHQDADLVRKIGSIIVGVVLTALTLGLLDEFKNLIFPPQAPAAKSKPSTPPSITAPEVSAPSTISSPSTLKALEDAKNLSLEKGRSNMNFFESVEKGLTKAFESVTSDLGESLGEKVKDIPKILGDAGKQIVISENGTVTDSPDNFWDMVKKGLLGGFLKSSTGQELKKEATETVVNAQLASVMKSPITWVLGGLALVLLLGKVKV